MLKLLAIHVVDLALHVSAVVAGPVALHQVYMMMVVGGYARLHRHCQPTRRPQFTL